MDDNKSGGYMGFWIIYVFTAAIVYACCILLKAANLIGWSWPAALLSFLWIPFADLAVCLLLLLIITEFYRFQIWRMKRKRRRNTAKTLKYSMEGMTLNAIGPIYGVKRVPGEKNRRYKRRILKAARTIDTVQIPTTKHTPDDHRAKDKK